MKSKDIITNELLYISQNLGALIEYADPFDFDELDDDSDTQNVVFYDDVSKNDSATSVSWSAIIRILQSDYSERRDSWVELEVLYNDRYPEVWPGLTITATHGLKSECKDQLQSLIEEMKHETLSNDWSVATVVRRIKRFLDENYIGLKPKDLEATHPNAPAAQRGRAFSDFDLGAVYFYRKGSDASKLSRRAHRKGHLRRSYLLTQDNALDVEFSSGFPKLKSRYLRDFEELKLLGSGGFGAVTKVRQLYGNGVFAVKSIPICKTGQIKSLTEEASMLAKLNHRHIVRYYDAWIETHTVLRSDPLASNNGFNYQLLLPHSRRYYMKLDEWKDRKRLAAGNKGKFRSISFSDDSEENDYFENTDKLSDVSHSSAHGHPPFREMEGLRISNPHEEMESDHLRASLDMYSAQQYLYILMEFCPGKSLRETIDSGTLHNDKQMIWMLSRQILEALAYMHEIGVIHRDLKPSNIFLSEDNGELNVKIGDFGLTTTIGGEQSSQCMDVKDTKDKSTEGRLSAGVGTLYYMAPELINGEEYDQKVDMFSFGVVLFEMWHPPFLTAMELIVVLSNLTREKKFPLEFESTADPRVLQILRNLLFSKSEERFSAAALLESVLFQTDVDARSQKIYEVISRHRYSDESIQLMATLFSRNEEDSKTRYYFHGKDSQFDAVAPLAMVVKRIWQQIFRRRGAVQFHPPILQPKKHPSEKLFNIHVALNQTLSTGKRRIRHPVYGHSVSSQAAAAANVGNTQNVGSLKSAFFNSRVAVCLMDSSGTLLYLPYQHLYGFAQTAPFLKGSYLYRRWIFNPIFDGRSVKGSAGGDKDVQKPYMASSIRQYPNETHSCAYDIILSLDEFLEAEYSTKDSEGFMLAVFDAELIAVASEVLSPFLHTLGRLVFKWTHVNLLPTLLEEFFDLSPMSVESLDNWIRTNLPNLTAQRLHEKFQTFLPVTLGCEESIELLWSILKLEAMPLGDFLCKLMNFLAPEEFDAPNPPSDSSVAAPNAAVIPADMSTHSPTWASKTLPSPKAFCSPHPYSSLLAGTRLANISKMLHAYISRKSKRFQEMMEVLFLFTAYLETLYTLEDSIVFELALDYPEQLFSNGIAFYVMMETAFQKQEILIVGGRYDKLIDTLNTGIYKRLPESGRLAGFGFEIIAETVIQKLMEDKPGRISNVNLLIPSVLNYSTFGAITKKGLVEHYYPRVLITVNRKELERAAFTLRHQLIKRGITCERIVSDISDYHKLKKQYKRATHPMHHIEWLVLIQGTISSIKAEQELLTSQYRIIDCYFKLENLQGDEEKGFSTETDVVKFLESRLAA